MKTALILHGTDFSKKQRQRLNNWFPWLKTELEHLGYQVWLPELPQAWQPDIERYWRFLKNFDFNPQTILIGHSSGAAAIFGLLQKLPPLQKVHLVISVAGFYKDNGWNCTGLFTQKFNWPKIKNQAQKFYLIWSPDDPYVTREQTDYLSNKLDISPTIMDNHGHFNLESDSRFRQLPELLDLIQSEIS
jgi:predicted alpha/beta hydrolase family esterase